MLYTKPNEGDHFWKQDVTKRDFKPISVNVMRRLGLTNTSTKMVRTIEELRDSPPNIVVAEAAKKTKFVQNWFKEQQLNKKGKYVMGLGVFQQLHHDMQGQTKLLKPAGVMFKKIYNPYIGQDLNRKTLLVFRTGGIGDLLFIQPNLLYLKEKYPDCFIKFACGPQYQPMVDTWDCVDEVLDLPFNVQHMYGAYHLLFEGVIERCQQAETENAYNLFSKWMGLDLPDELLIPRQEPDPLVLNECRNVLDKFGVLERNFIVMQLRASSPVRTPNVKYWKRLIDKLTGAGFTILLTDNPRQQEDIDRFIDMLENKEKVFNFCKYSATLQYTIALTKMAKAVMGTDSALMHIAASMDIPCFGLYGPFPGHIRLKTYPKADWIDGIRHCSPCYIHGHKPCPQAESDGFSPCYNNIDFNEVVERFTRLLYD